MTNLEDRHLEELFRESYRTMMPHVLESVSMPIGGVDDRVSLTFPQRATRHRRSLVLAVVSAAFAVGVAGVASWGASGHQPVPGAPLMTTSETQSLVSDINLVPSSTSSPLTSLDTVATTASPSSNPAGVPPHPLPGSGRSLVLPSDEWRALFANSFEVLVEQCMNDHGFDYTPRPPVGDTPDALSAASAWEQWRRQQFATIDGYEKVLYGTDPETDPGCQLKAFPVMFDGAARSDQIASDVEAAHSSEWRRTALQDARLAPDLAQLTTCLENDGYAVTPQRDVMKAARQFETNTGTSVSTLCPVWTDLNNRLSEISDEIEQKWFADNPDALADITDRYAADVIRFTAIIEGDIVG